MTDHPLVEHRLINMAQGKGDRKLRAFAKKKNDVERYAKKTATLTGTQTVPSGDIFTSVGTWKEPQQVSGVDACVVEYGRRIKR